MSAKIIDGKKCAADLKEKIKEKVQLLKTQGKGSPSLVVVIVGDDPASKTYVANKEKACQEVGFSSKTISLSADTSEESLLRNIDTLNNDDSVDGILVQMPLPKHIDKTKAILRISPHKDVDGLTPQNQGRLNWNLSGLFPCTPLGVMELLKNEEPSLVGKFAVVLGYSLLVGAPLATMLTHERATVVSIRSTCPNPKDFTRTADIVIAATGSPLLVTADWLKPGVIVIDVGIHRVGKKLVGDVEFESVSKIAKAITPVPGGVGPMTIAMLLMNCLKAFEQKSCS